MRRPSKITLRNTSEGTLRDRVNKNKNACECNSYHMNLTARVAREGSIL